MTRATTSRTTPGIRKMQGAYYMPIPAQGGGTRIFWSYAGKTRKEAEARLKGTEAPTKNDPLAPRVRKRIWGRVAAHRRRDTARFNKTSCVAFYTDAPHRFSGRNSNNPTAVLFDCAGVRYEFISSEQILAGELNKYQVIFLPGGFGDFPDRAMSRRLRDFVRAGGGFIGFCAGAFLPLKDFLGLCDSTFAYFREQGFPDVLINPKDPIGLGIKSTVNPVCYALSKPTPRQRKCTVRIKMFRGNGPLLIAGGKDKAVGYFDSTEDYSPIIRGTHGKGRVVSVSTHPDCSMVKMIEAASEDNVVENVKLFKNAVLYCGGTG